MWLMQGWHSVGTVKKKGTWEAAELGERLKVELSKGNTAVGMMVMGMFIGIGVGIGLVIGMGLN